MTEKNRITEARYRELFLLDQDPTSDKPKEVLDKPKEALRQALEIRKFEIELYWKRATYFWTFIGAAFVAFGVFYNTTPAKGTSAVETRERALVLISCIGFVFSLAWYYVNKGSKFWQENWENHVSLLEDAHIGPLYKSRAERPAAATASWKDRIAYSLVAPAPFSVSKINQIVSIFVTIIWALVLIDSSLLAEFLADLFSRVDQQHPFTPKLIADLILWANPQYAFTPKLLADLISWVISQYAFTTKLLADLILWVNSQCAFATKPLADLASWIQSQYRFAPKKAIPIALALLAWLLFRWIGKSHQGDHHPAIYLRTVAIDNPTTSPQEKNKTSHENNCKHEAPAIQPQEPTPPPKKHQNAKTPKRETKT
ncbi:hypothetical protein JYK02_08805 [Corallococcus macrosporus]|uniref:DUF2868 domain-containing protein n=1 Tax=Corallococcus macrosporus TaxID=35 RepID=A0ABS3D7G3_9BACT|nr:hypothetical protein [Corallococcus macrosporus]MBN8227604.1 hypothetical protein [Corallococcus macrosporus]